MNESLCPVCRAEITLFTGSAAMCQELLQILHGHHFRFIFTTAQCETCCQYPLLRGDTAEDSGRRLGDVLVVSLPLGSSAGSRPGTGRWVGRTWGPTSPGIMPRCLATPGSGEGAAEEGQAPMAAWTARPSGHRGSLPFQPSPALSASARNLDEEVGRWDPNYSTAPVLRPRLWAGQQGFEAWTISRPIQRLTEPGSRGPLVSVKSEMLCHGPPRSSHRPLLALLPNYLRERLNCPVFSH